MIYRKDVDEARARCLTMGVDFEIEDYKIRFQGDKYILDKYTGDELEVYLNDIFDEVSTNAFMGRDIKFIDFGTVKKIPKLCFNNCYTLEKVIAHNVKEVGSEAFKNCFSLTTVEFGKVKVLEGRVFADCPNLENLVGLEKLESIGGSCFINCYKLIKFDLEKVIYIGEKAFLNCINLKEVSFNQLEFLAKRVFSNCYNLNKIDTPKVKQVMPCAICGCLKLEEICLYDFEDINLMSTNDALLSLKKIHFMNKHINIDEDLLKLRLDNVKAKEVEILYE